MPVENPFRLIAPITDLDSASCFIHLVERAYEDIDDYIAEWADVSELSDSESLRLLLATPEKKIEFAEWLRKRVAEEEHVEEDLALYFAPYRRVIYLAQGDDVHMELGPQQAKRLRDCLSDVLATDNFDGKEIKIEERG